MEPSEQKAGIWQETMFSQFFTLLRVHGQCVLCSVLLVKIVVSSPREDRTSVPFLASLCFQKVDLCSRFSAPIGRNRCIFQLFLDSMKGSEGSSESWNFYIALQLNICSTGTQ